MEHFQGTDSFEKRVFISSFDPDSPFLGLLSPLYPLLIKHLLFLPFDFRKEPFVSMHVSRSWTLQQFLTLSSQVFPLFFLAFYGVKALLHAHLGCIKQRLDSLEHPLVRIFNEEGVELDDLLMVEDDEKLILTSGSMFSPHYLHNGTKMASGCIKSSSIKEEEEGEEEEGGRERGDSGCEGEAAEEMRREVIGDYEILSELGKGGFGHVMKGRHLGTQEVVALKFIKKVRSFPLCLSLHSLFLFFFLRAR